MSRLAPTRRVDARSCLRPPMEGGSGAGAERLAASRAQAWAPDRRRAWPWVASLGGLLGALLALGCEEGGSGGGLGGAGAAGALAPDGRDAPEVEGARGEPEVYPTRACVLAGSCGICYDDEQCWEGYGEGSCPSWLVEPTFTMGQTCPEVGYPVNCSGQNKFEPPGTGCPVECSHDWECPGTCCTASGTCAASAGWCGGSTPCGVSGDVCSPSKPCCSGLTCKAAVCKAGGSGGSGGSGGDACSECLDTCKGLPGCCTGSGCMCDDECGVDGCTAPYELCCGPYGDCICTTNCPY